MLLQQFLTIDQEGSLNYQLNSVLEKKKKK